jgi:poly(3-hydroxyalkanoate) synthetase
MNISLDYDKTYTLDPKMWDTIINIMLEAGHKVYMVSSRSPSNGKEVLNALKGKVNGIYFTDNKAKKTFMKELRIRIDVWIDDKPKYILLDDVN